MVASAASARTRLEASALTGPSGFVPSCAARRFGERRPDVCRRKERGKYGPNMRCPCATAGKALAWESLLGSEETAMKRLSLGVGFAVFALAGGALTGCAADGAGASG